MIKFSKPCGKCSDDQPCDKKTGQCNSNECAVGWWGEPEENGQVRIDLPIFIANL